jgi:hypothetical protein
MTIVYDSTFAVIDFDEKEQTRTNTKCHGDRKMFVSLSQIVHQQNITFLTT